MPFWILLMLCTVAAGTDPMHVALESLVLGKDLAMDLRSYNVVPEYHPDLSSGRFMGRYLGYLGRYLEGDVPRPIRRQGEIVHKMLSTLTTKVPYRKVVTQPVMLNLTLSFTTKLLDLLDS